MMLSPSSINTYYKCPRLFYYKYIKRMSEKPSIHLYRGKKVHTAIENAFKYTKYHDNISDRIKKSFEEKWKPGKDLDLTDEELTKFKDESLMMLESFFNRFDERINIAVMDQKINDKNHAWNILKPRLREHKIILDDEKVMGIIDSVEKSFDGKTFIIDYKTSKMFKNIVTDDYIRQVRIYAYLYYKDTGELPDFVGINYLRYGEIYLFPVTNDMLKLAERDIQFVRENVSSTKKEDYPKGCGNTKWCNCGDFEEMDNQTQLADVKQGTVSS